ncbi:hypothetical protein [Natroniella sp. ANB-PHB2]|uniref:hypothetical protein n=1 Tax=Natroniella sp. ANB-PHB2 TaxID=3384444 RepID=UPI0038D47757
MFGVVIDLVGSLIGWLSLLSLLIVVLVKWKPGLDPYFRKGAVILAEVDDAIDGILLEFPENDSLNTINDLVSGVLAQLDEAGYKVDGEDRQKVENRLKAKVRREEGLRLDRDDEEYRIRYSREF